MSHMRATCYKHEMNSLQRLNFQGFGGLTMKTEKSWTTRKVIIILFAHPLVAVLQ